MKLACAHCGLYKEEWGGETENAKDIRFIIASALILHLATSNMHSSLIINSCPVWQKNI